ncbi:MAG TPA: DUF177 domain-containing protein [Thermoanaerobaculia bacterium]|nr:DUF177 domain-containing protein [Thermoanaerobaculia bacterium]
MSDVIRFDDIDEHGPQTYKGHYEVPVAELDRDELAGNVSIDIEARVEKGSFEGEYVADGQSRVTMDLNCSRCLDPYPFANAAKLHVRFRPRLEASGPEEEEMEIGGEEELDVEFYGERSIPLHDLAFEQVQLTIPMKPLCDENCLGLCPKCGTNRSRERCSCDPSVTDERWTALQGIRDQLSNKKNQ